MAESLDPEALARELAALRVDDVLAATASTLVTLAGSKLDGGDLAEARKAIDALVALAPQLESALRGELERAVAALQVAFVQAGSPRL